MKLYVGNLPFSVEETELKSLFSKFPSVVSCILVKDQETGRSRGFAFVEFSSSDEATRAIVELNNKPMGSSGRMLVVNEARPREARPPRDRDSRDSRDRDSRDRERSFGNHRNKM